MVRHELPASTQNVATAFIPNLFEMTAELGQEAQFMCHCLCASLSGGHQHRADTDVGVVRLNVEPLSVVIFKTQAPDDGLGQFFAVNGNAVQAGVVIMIQKIGVVMLGEKSIAAQSVFCATCVLQADDVCVLSKQPV